jgi:hypothetical protein
MTKAALEHDYVSLDRSLPLFIIFELPWAKMPERNTGRWFSCGYWR